MHQACDFQLYRTRAQRNGCLLLLGVHNLLSVLCAGTFPGAGHGPAPGAAVQRRPRAQHYTPGAIDNNGTPDPDGAAGMSTSCALCSLSSTSKKSFAMVTRRWACAQVAIFEILHKYDGVKVHDDVKLGRRRYKITRLPRFMAMQMKRFTKNNFYVGYPHGLLWQLLWRQPSTSLAHRLDFYAGGEEPDYCELPSEEPAAEGRHRGSKRYAMTLTTSGVLCTSELGHGRWRFPLHHGVICAIMLVLGAGVDGQPVLSKYDLLANIVHDGKAGEGSYRLHVHRKVLSCLRSCGDLCSLILRSGHAANMLDDDLCAEKPIISQCRS